MKFFADFKLPHSHSDQRVFSPRRRAFTLVELLVVIAIIGVLVALLLPAVQAAREAGRRATCQNKIRQIALALHNFESAVGNFPSGMVAYSTSGGLAGFCEEGLGRGGTPNGNIEVFPALANGCDKGGPSWTVAILPYLEQQALFDRFPDNKKGFASQLDSEDGVNYDGTCVNGQLQMTPLEIWRCPTDPFVNTPEGELSNCYHACSGGGDKFIDNPNFDNSSLCQTEDCNVACRGTAWVNLQNFKNGIFYPNSEMKIAQVSDGLSNTVMLGENRMHFVRGNHGGIPGRQSGWASNYATSNQHGAQINVGSTADTINDTRNAAGFPIETGRDPTSYWDYDTVFSSFHPGGAHFAYGDASVHFLSEDMDLEIYRSMGRREDGYPFGGEQ